MTKSNKKSLLQFFAESTETKDASGAQEAELPAQESQDAADIQGSAESGASADEKPRDKTADFNRMINGEYKSEYQAALENVLSKRLKTSNKKLAKSEELISQLRPLIEKLAIKYSIEDSADIGAIIAAAEQDNSYYEEYAKGRGVDIEGAKQLIEAKRITDENERRKAEEERETQFAGMFEGWLRQADEVKQKYPSFDFEYESLNDETGEEFRRLLNSGIDVESAYTVIHKNEIMGGAMQYAYQRAKQDMADARTNRLNRPNENGVSSNHSSAIIDDMAKLTPSQRQKIKAAVSRGERVSAENFRRFL